MHNDTYMMKRKIIFLAMVLKVLESQLHICADNYLINLSIAFDYNLWTEHAWIAFIVYEQIEF